MYVYIYICNYPLGEENMNAAISKLKTEITNAEATTLPGILTNEGTQSHAHAMGSSKAQESTLKQGTSDHTETSTVIRPRPAG